MSRIGLAPDQLVAKRVRAEFFKSFDPFAFPFTARLTWGGVFYPTDGYWLQEDQFSALDTACTAFGSRDFYLSAVEGTSAAEEPVVLCESPTYSLYRELELVPLETALYSRTGDWAILISHEDHAVIGGTQSFGGALEARYPRLREDFDQLARYWAENPNGGWLQGMARHITCHSTRP